MKVRSNEQGSTLLIVLLLIVVFTILGVGLLTMNISASKQFNNKEEQVQARHLAEMGILHFQAKVKKVVELHNQEFEYVYDLDNNRKKYFEELCSKTNNVVITNHSATQGSYEVNKLPHNSTNCTVSSSIPNEIVVAIKSVGSTDGAEKVIEAEVKIKSENENEDEEGQVGDGNGNDEGKHEPPTGDDVEYINADFKIEQGGYVPKKNSMYINGNLHAENGNKATNLTVEKDLYINGNIDINNHACIVVKGDLTVLGTNHKVVAHLYIIVYGDAYFENGPDIKNSGGIYVKGNVAGNHLGDSSNYKIPINACGELDESPSTPNNPLDFNWQVQSSVNPNYK